VLLTVAAPEDTRRLEGHAFGRGVRFWPAGGGVWQGLLAVDLSVLPGSHDVEIVGQTADGTLAIASVQIAVHPADFETRELRVADRFVNPSPAETARIEADAVTLARIFSDSAPVRLWSGAFQAPVPGRATSSFGRLTVFNGEPRGQHRGTDFRAAQGVAVRAPNGGRVTLAEDLYFTGNTVVVDHGLGLFSLFAHLSRMMVTPGTEVARGTLIGRTGSTGRVTGPHLHWTVRVGDASVDPLSLITVTRELRD
jgi:murein DD-endopeptidase MepM/ murein hydrolase activator NlpD